MTQLKTRWTVLSGLLCLSLTMSGCMGFCKKRSCGDAGCSTNGACKTGGCRSGCNSGDCGDCDDCGGCCGCLGKCFNRRSMAIPDVQPLGSVNRAHYHTMQANAEAADFIFHRHEFVGKTPALTPSGKDHILEVAARMRSAPFPVLIERSENNADPELDVARRDLVAQVLMDCGNEDANQRTIVAPAYGKGINSREAEVDYFRFTFSRGGFGNFGNNLGAGFGGGGFGGGFGGGGFGF